MKEILFTAAEAAVFAGIDERTLRNYEPAGFGSPGHWRMVGSMPVYTAAGCRLLAQALSLAGQEESAEALLEAVNKVEAAASAARTAAPKPAWMERADLA